MAAKAVAIHRRSLELYDVLAPRGVISTSEALSDSCRNLHFRPASLPPISKSAITWDDRELPCRTR